MGKNAGIRVSRSHGRDKRISIVLCAHGCANIYGFHMEKPWVCSSLFVEKQTKIPSGRALEAPQMR